MERIVGGIFIEAAMPSSCSHSCRQFLTIIQAFAHTESEKHSPPSVAKISARYTLRRNAVAVPGRHREADDRAALRYSDRSLRMLWKACPGPTSAADLRCIGSRTSTNRPASDCGERTFEQGTGHRA